MRKLIFLKSIVDFVFFMSFIGLLFGFFLILFLICSSEPIDIPIKINGSTIIPNSLTEKIALSCAAVGYCIGVYAFYLFKKLLDNFRKLIIFDEVIPKLLKNICNVLLLIALTILASELLMMFSKSKVEINFGYGPFVIVLALGLFFNVLSEVFKMGINLRQDNDLTI